MNSYAKYIETLIEQEPENKLLEASALYQKSFGAVPKMTYYKTLERMSKQGSLMHLTKGLYYRPKNHALEQFRSVKKRLSVTIQMMVEEL